METLPRILLVEDDRTVAGALTKALIHLYDITVASNGALALAKADNETFDYIILDLHLPDMTGSTICEHLRRRGIQAPILVLSGENRILTKINLLDAGANDYLTKPFSLGELKARLRALGRSEKQPTIRLQPVLTVADVELNRQTYQVTRQGVAVPLRRKEFALLECLMENAGTVVSREALNRTVWNTETMWTNTLDVHIKYLRDKLDRPFGKPMIKTIHGRGYRLEVSTDPADEVLV